MRGVRMFQMGMMWKVALLGLVVLTCSLEGHVQAQSVEKKIENLNAKATDAYTNLDIDGAETALKEAESLIKKNNIAGSVAAKTYVTLGLLWMGGFQEEAKAKKYFILAIQNDPKVQPDLQLSTPDVQALFEKAKKEAAKLAPKESESPKETPVVDPPPVPEKAEVTLIDVVHKRAAEQLRRTPVPVYVELPQDTEVDAVVLHYRKSGAPVFDTMDMREHSIGYGSLIPCIAAMGTSVEYYIEVVGKEGKTIGKVGKSEEPISIPIVKQRNRKAPALPGSTPPLTCPDGVCAPGEENCADEGALCENVAQCKTGLMCEAGECISKAKKEAAQKQAEKEAEEALGVAPKFFAHLGFGFGGGLAMKGAAADRAVPNECLERDDNGNITGINNGMVGGVDCSQYASFTTNDDPDCSLGDGEFCVLVNQQGFSPTYALNLATGYYVLPNLAVAATFRFQFNSGRGTFANILLGARAQYLFTDPTPEGFYAAAALGASYGQIQIKVDQDNAIEPYIVSGFGNMNTSAILGYRFLENVGAFFEPRFHVMFPTFLFAMEANVGVEAAF